jgi:hypothetical protein
MVQGQYGILETMKGCLPLWVMSFWKETVQVLKDENHVLTAGYRLNR